VQISPAGAQTWVLTQTNQPLYPFDRLRTGTNSRVALRWSDQSIIPFGSSTELEILPPPAPESQSGLHLIRGVISFFHRDKPGRIRIITRGAVAGVEGTEFVLSVTGTNESERTTLSVVDGKVRFGNDQAMLLLTNHQQAVVESSNAPVRTPGFVVNNVLQWCFYYPAVLELTDLPLTPDERSTLDRSLEAYGAGNLPAALAHYPAGRQPGSDAERIYYAALLLSVGEVEKTESILSKLSDAETSQRTRRLGNALRQLIATVKGQTNLLIADPQLATERLARSYYEQSRAVPGDSLPAALSLAREAAIKSPTSGMAWARIAELEFGFGRTREAREALEKSLVLSPENPQALALKGFLLAAENNTSEAIKWFDRALAIDSSFGNAWLGRGLCRIHRGDTIGGREDLLVAAALEPQRAELRSYLGKAYADTGDRSRAAKELDLAKSLDPEDPTSWLYSALFHGQNNRINEAIDDLEKSKELNDNRSVYRSQLLLDQDRAVRSANLAAAYQDAGMSEVAVREASRAANYDYANYSTHLFLANSYNDLSDPNLTNLRYETAAQSEYLLANLLAPASAGTMSPTLSLQEYSSLFEKNRVGVVSETEYLSRGAWTESGAQYGIFDGFSYSLEAFYRTDPGQRANNDLEVRQLSLTLKQQVTSQDSVYVQVKQFKAESGDLAQYYDPATANRQFRVKEEQEPIVGIGYHREWSPGVHSLIFAAHLDDSLSLTNPTGPTLMTIRPGDPPQPQADALVGLTMQQKLKEELDIYSVEAQQIWQTTDHNTILGARGQYGNIDMKNVQGSPSAFFPFFPAPPDTSADQDIESLFKRFSIYGYHQWQVFDSVQLIGGLTYDWVSFPENFQNAPVSGNEKTVDQISPKAGVIWRPLPDSTVRFAYTRSLSGASLDQSYRLEPSQVAGFIQSYRSIIPESVVGPNAGATFETFGLSLEQKFPTRTYVGVTGELLNSKVNRMVGVFESLDTNTFAIPSILREQLDYDEQSVLFTANQLVGQEWSFGARYRLSRAVLRQSFIDVPDPLPSTPPGSIPSRDRVEGVLHQVNLFAIFNHSSGVFTGGEAVWYSQSNKDYSPALPGDDFWQFNVSAGYRFPRRKAEITLGLLNITDEDYRLNPLNTYNDLPRERTIAVRFRLNF
jgi:tetratricopeptide (TPR) repeat protein